jgi:glutathione S-transferase
MTIKLYGVAASRVFRNLWALNELGLAFEHDPIRYDDPRLNASPYIELNPNARVPIIDVDGHVMYESLAINLYLAQAFAAQAPTGFVLATTEEQALGVQWALWAMTEVDDAINIWAMNSLIKPPEQRDTALAASALSRLQRPLDALDASLAKTGHVVGHRFTVADLNTAAVFYRALKMDLASRPRVHTWLHACLSRPAALAARRARGEAI